MFLLLNISLAAESENPSEDEKKGLSSGTIVLIVFLVLFDIPVLIYVCFNCFVLFLKLKEAISMFKTREKVSKMSVEERGFETAEEETKKVSKEQKLSINEQF